MLSLSCSNNDDKFQNNVPQELIGKWKIVEMYSTDGGSPPSWSTYDSGEVYDIWFKNDWTYSSTSSANPDCINGEYSISENYLTLFNSACAPEEPLIVENLTENELVIDANFIEPYKSKYEKIIE